MNLTALARACLAAYTANMATAYSQTNVSEQFAVS